MSVEGIDPATVTTFHELSEFRRDLLFAIRCIETDEDEAPHGLGIKEELETDHFGYDEVAVSTVYENLGFLVDAGLIEKTTVDRRTKQYATTEQARGLLEERVRLENDWIGLQQPDAKRGAE